MMVRGPLMFSLICAWIDGWVNNGEAGDLRRYRAHYDVIEMDKYFRSDDDNEMYNDISRRSTHYGIFFSIS